MDLASVDSEEGDHPLQSRVFMVNSKLAGEGELWVGLLIVSANVPENPIRLREIEGERVIKALLPEEYLRRGLPASYAGVTLPYEEET